MKNKVLLSAAAVAIFGASVLTAGTAFAQSSTTIQHPFSNLAEKIATKFNLNKDEVQAVFDQQHEEMRAQMEVAYEQRLSTLVSEGKITEAQKQLILAKHKEMIAQRETKMAEMQNLTEEQRKAAMEKEHASLEEWAKTNGIDLQYMKFVHRIKGPRGHMGDVFIQAPAPAAAN